MKGFVVFEVAPPFRWIPKYERDPRGGVFHRFIWLYFSVTFVFGMKWTDFIKALMERPVDKPLSRDQDEWFVG